MDLHGDSSPGGPAAQTGEASRLEDVKRTYPPMIVRFPEDNCLARYDQWLSLQLMSIHCGPLSHVLSTAGHLFSRPWYATCTTTLMIHALESRHPWRSALWVPVLLSLLPLAHKHISATEPSFVKDFGCVLPSLCGLLLILWVVDTGALHTASLFIAGTLYTTQASFLLSSLAGRPRPCITLASALATLPLPPAALHCSEGDDAFRSFPSCEAAAAGCLATAVFLSTAGQGRELVPQRLVLGLIAFAALGRVHARAESLLDMLAGLALGCCCTWAFAVGAPGEGCYSALLVWNLLSMGLLVALVVCGPLRAVAAAAMALTLASWAFGRCFTSLAFHVLLLALGYGLYLKTSFDQKSWVINQLEEFFSCIASQEQALPPSLQESLQRKRAELRTMAADPSSPFPSSVYSVYAYSPGEGPRPKPFAADWEDLGHIMSARLEDLSQQCGLDLQSIGVVLGIYTGGAMLAPGVAKRLGCNVCYIRVSRYSDDVLGYRGALRTLWEKASGKHDSLYRISDPPDEALLAGRAVLMVDDAVGTGGTFRAVHRYCMRAGARSAHGVALESMKPGRHIWDPALPNPRPQPLTVPCFVPWGLR